MSDRFRAGLISQQRHFHEFSDQLGGERMTSMTSSTFVLTIEMGNAAMLTPEDLGEKLHDIATDVQSGRASGIVRDENGNTVGRYGFRDDA